MTTPPFEINIGHHHYYRTSTWGTTKSAALAHAKKLHKEGHLAQAVKDKHTGKWSTYFAASSRRTTAFKRSLPKEIQHLVPGGKKP